MTFSLTISVFWVTSEEWFKDEKITFNLNQKQFKTHKGKDSEMERIITKTCAAEDNEEDSGNYWICLHETQKFTHVKEQVYKAVHGSCTQR